METEEILVALQKAAETTAAPNWADKLSVVISLLAVIVAGFVAWKQYGITKKQNELSEQQAKIMDQQNKIAVFDKQFELYDITEKCLQFAKGISLTMGFEPKTVTLSNIRSTFLGTFSDTYVAKDAIDQFDFMFYYQEVCKIRKKLHQAEFLFSEEISRPLLSLADNLMYLICSDVFTNSGMPFEALILSFTASANTLETEEILKKMKSEVHQVNTAA